MPQVCLWCCRFVVLNRPYAFLQWVQKATIPERYVLMSEPDHVWIKPLSNIMLGERPIAFPFFYIEPWKDEYLPITTKHLGPLSKRQAEEIAPIGELKFHLAGQQNWPASDHVKLSVSSSAEPTSGA